MNQERLLRENVRRALGVYYQQNNESVAGEGYEKNYEDEAEGS